MKEAMKADIAKDDFQWMMNWLSDNGYLVTKVELLTSGWYDKVTYSITYELKAVVKED